MMTALYSCAIAVLSTAAGAAVAWRRAARGPVREAYRDRAHLAAVVAAHPQVKPTIASDPHAQRGRDTVLFLGTPVGQISLHIADADVDLISLFARRAPLDSVAIWDGHLKPEARARLQAFAELLATSHAAGDDRAL